MKGAVSAIALACALGAASTALAQVPQGDWRRRDRRVDPDKFGSPRSFAFELRFGPYYPEVDEEFEDQSPTPTPYADVFGTSAQFYIGMEVDWLPLRVPYVGLVGPGFGWGYTRTSGHAMRQDTCVAGVSETCEAHEDAETSLTIMPMHLSAVLRADEIMRRTVVPIVPYMKLGLGLATWSISSPSGLADSLECSGGECTNVMGRDTTWGIHFAVGGMLGLNWLDPQSSAALDDSTGVNGAYLFGEWMNTQLDGLGSRPQMHVGTSTWIVGLALDM